MEAFDVMADEEINLKDALIRSLNEEGILPKLQAQLKAAVYLALEKHNYAEGIPSLNQSVRSFWSTEDGLIIASLLVDFMTVMKFENTLNVLKHEAQMEQLQVLDGDTLLSLLPVKRTSENSPVLLSLLEALKNLRTSNIDETDSSPSVSNNSRKKSSRIPVLQSRKMSLQSQASDETVGTPSHKVSKSSKASESPRIHQDSAFQETINNCNNRLNMRSPTSGFADSLHPLTPTSPTSGNVSKAESIGRPNSGYISPSIVRVYAPVKKQSSVNDDKSDVDDEDDDIEEVLRTEESVADDAVDQTVDSSRVWV
ncbi:unnamed protein product [Heterobilharzia americana]|nr:unnamed protein product [Heterobilharzia americana]